MYCNYRQNPIDKHSRSTSKNILRVISSTFRSRFPASSTSPPPASPSSSPRAKQRREAALRERGLLPPRDLSRQEADQDRRNPVIPPDRSSFNNSPEPSAAQVIRQQWEDRNMVSTSTMPAEAGERERMKHFRFGPSLSASASSPDLSRSPPSETVAKVNEPPRFTVLGDISPDSMNDVRRFSHQPSASSRQSMPVANDNLPRPLALKHDGVDHAPNVNGHKHGGSHHSSLSAPPCTNPVISLTPPCHSSSFSRSSSISSSAASLQRRPDSPTRLTSISESSSLRTPSLENPSRSSTLNTTRSSTLNTTESSSVGCRYKGKNNLLGLKIPEYPRSVPMIIESPVEGAMVFDMPESPPLWPLPTLEMPMHQPVLTRRERGYEDAGKREKQKSFNPFKRTGQSTALSDENYRPMFVSSSMGNLRRGVDDWTKTRSSYDAPFMVPVGEEIKIFDTPHLPPSPKPSKHFKTSSSDTTSTGLSVRKPLQPTLHTRGSIIHEMKTIENDEVRRVTELAFLG